MIRSLFVSGVLSLICFTAQAQETILIQKKPTIIEESSSEHNRMGKNWVVEAQIIGVGDATGIGSGVIVGRHLDRNTIVQLEATSGTREDGFGTNHLKANVFGAHIKKFISNSFYAKGGLDYATIKKEDEYFFVSTGSRDYYHYEANLWAATIAIGNQWQWETFTLGCDWIGLSQPLAHNISSQWAAEPAAAKDRDAHRNRLLANGTVQAIRFYVGATF